MKHRFVPSSRFQPWQRLGLRARITILFALGGLVLSAILALATLYLTRQNLLTQREADSIDVLNLNATSLNSKLTQDISAETIQAVLATLNSSQGALPLVQTDDVSVTGGRSSIFNGESLPPSLEQLVLSRRPGRIRTTIDGQPMLVLGVPLQFDVQYYEAVPLKDIEKTLDSLSYILLGSSAATAGLAALLGAWASLRMLRPLTEISGAAEAIAGGNLDTRLIPPADRDLASLTASFNEMAGALQERIERDARFASEVSHELRSPLMTLTASVEVLETRRDELPERAQTAVDLLASDLERFKQLVEEEENG